MIAAGRLQGGPRCTPSHSRTITVTFITAAPPRKLSAPFALTHRREDHAGASSVSFDGAIEHPHAFPASRLPRLTRRRKEQLKILSHLFIMIAHNPQQTSCAASGAPWRDIACLHANGVRIGAAPLQHGERAAPRTVPLPAHLRTLRDLFRQAQSPL